MILGEGWICHTSGNPKHAFIYGLYFYTLLIPCCKSLSALAQSDGSPLPSFQFESTDFNTQSSPVTPIPSHGTNAGLLSCQIQTTTSSALSYSTVNMLISSPITTTINNSNVGLSNSVNISTPSTVNVPSASSVATTSSTVTTVANSTTSNITNNSCGFVSSSTASNVTTNNNNISLWQSRQTENNMTNPSMFTHSQTNTYTTIPTSQQPIPFPQNYLPKISHGTVKSTNYFQNEWAEVAIVYSNYQSQSQNQRLSQQQQSQTSLSSQHCSSINVINSNISPDFQTLNDDSGQNNFTSESTQSKELCQFFKNGYLQYCSVQNIFGLTDKTGFEEIDSVLRKTSLCDLDDPDHDDRVKWVHCVYDANYHPTCAFSIEFQWLVATGYRMAELVSLWHQKAGTANLHFFPVPCYPFGQPDKFSEQDALRTPIHIPINTFVLIETVKLCKVVQSDDYHLVPNDCITNPITNNVLDLADCLFPDIPKQKRLVCIRFFQDFILRKFGFLRDTCDINHVNYISCFDSSNSNHSKQLTYVHCSGGMFVMIPRYENDEKIIKKTDENSLPSSQMENFKEIIYDDEIHTHNNVDESEIHTKLKVDPSTNCFLLQKKFCYFWQWNHMLPRRWRGHLTGDEAFQDGMLSDFRAFLNAEDKRLSQSLLQFRNTFIKKLNNAH